jgi:hypothetical protein
MKDIDKLLEANAPVPKRELGADFTATTLAKLADGKPTKLGRIKETFTMRFATFARAHKPAAIAAAVIGLIVISGTATAATVGWPNVLALFAGQKTFTDGSRVIKVETKNCQFVTALNVTKQRTGKDGEYYYRIKADSKLTNEQVTSMVQGQCDMEAEAQLNMDALKAVIGEHNTSYIGAYVDNTITAISPTSVSIAFDMPVSSNDGTSYHHTELTFNHIDPNVLILDMGEHKVWSDLKVGDHIAFSYRAIGDALSHSEDMPLWKLNTDEATIAIVMKNPSDVTQALQFQRYHGTEIEEVTPCDKQPDGYCTIQELNQK